jgi:hypothetical protein
MTVPAVVVIGSVVTVAALAVLSRSPDHDEPRRAVQATLIPNAGSTGSIRPTVVTTPFVLTP